MNYIMMKTIFYTQAFFKFQNIDTEEKIFS